MEGFTVGLALVDAIPVLSFGISMVIIAGRFQSPLFMVGVGLSVLAVARGAFGGVVSTSPTLKSSWPSLTESE